MAGAEKVAEKIPAWVEGLLIPTLEARVRGVVKEEVGHLEKTMNAKFDAMNARFDAVDTKFNAVGTRFDAVNARFDALDEKFDAVNARIDALEGRIPMMQDIADIKARIAILEKREVR
jgi:hypothetical protein